MSDYTNYSPPGGAGYSFPDLPPKPDIESKSARSTRTGTSAKKSDSDKSTGVDQEIVSNALNQKTSGAKRKMLGSELTITKGKVSNKSKEQRFKQQVGITDRDSSSVSPAPSTSQPASRNNESTAQASERTALPSNPSELNTRPEETMLLKIIQNAEPAPAVAKSANLAPVTEQQALAIKQLIEEKKVFVDQQFLQAMALVGGQPATGQQEIPVIAIEMALPELNCKVKVIHSPGKLDREIIVISDVILGQGAFKVATLGIRLGDEIDRSKYIVLAEGQLTGKERDAIQIRNIKNEMAFYKSTAGHPNIAKAHQAMIIGQDKVGLMLDVYDDSLEEALSKSAEAIPKKQLPNVMVTMASALNYVHGQGYFHRDIKLDNFFVNYDPSSPDKIKVFLADPGMATNKPNRTEMQADAGFGPYISPDFYVQYKRDTLFNSMLKMEMESRGHTSFSKLPAIEKASVIEATNASILAKSDVYALGHVYFGMLNQGKALPWVREYLDVYDRIRDKNTPPGKLPKLNQQAYAILENHTSRSAQKGAGYKEPSDIHSLEHLVWEMIDPDTTRRPSMQEVQRRLAQLAVE